MDLTTFLQLFAWPLAALAIAALTAPLVGAFLVCRGATFQGVVLPQVAAFGVAVGWLVFPLLPHDGAGVEGHVHADDEVGRGYLLGCAALAVAAGQAFLALRSGRTEARASAESALFVLASGGVVVCAQLAPLGGLHVETILSGEVLATGAGDAVLLAVVLAAVALTVHAQWRRITVAGHDHDFAEATGQDPARAHVLLAALTALVVVSGTLTVGALAMFALLVLPSLAAARLARSMAGLLVLAPALGLLTATLGGVLSFAADLPVGASVVGGGAAVWLNAALLGAIRR